MNICYTVRSFSWTSVTLSGAFHEHLLHSPELFMNICNTDRRCSWTSIKSQQRFLGTKSFNSSRIFRLAIVTSGITLIVYSSVFAISLLKKITKLKIRINTQFVIINCNDFIVFLGFFICFWTNLYMFAYFESSSSRNVSFPI